MPARVHTAGVREKRSEKPGAIPRVKRSACRRKRRKSGGRKFRGRRGRWRPGHDGRRQREDLALGGGRNRSCSRLLRPRQIRRGATTRPATMATGVCATLDVGRRCPDRGDLHPAQHEAANDDQRQFHSGTILPQGETQPTLCCPPFINFWRPCPSSRSCRRCGFS